MYKSPIEIITSDMKVDMEKKQGDMIYRAVQEVNINVDRDELMNALKYDRGQYQKGYVDGIKEFAERLKTINHDGIDVLVKEMTMGRR